jgi:hypothetical protein
MNKESAFSLEYEITNATESLDAEKSSTHQAKVSDKIIDRIESDYQLSKPRRKLIRARIMMK